MNDIDTRRTGGQGRAVIGELVLVVVAAAVILMAVFVVRHIEAAADAQEDVASGASVGANGHAGLDTMDRRSDASGPRGSGNMEVVEAGAPKDD